MPKDGWRRTALLGAAAVCVLGALMLGFAAMRWFIAPRAVYVSGEVIAATPEGFVVRDTRGAMRDIVLGTDVSPKHGGEYLSAAPPVGSYVIVTGGPLEHGRIEARSVRVFNEMPSGTGQGAAAPPETN